MFQSILKLFTFSRWWLIVRQHHIVAKKCLLCYSTRSCHKGVATTTTATEATTINRVIIKHTLSFLVNTYIIGVIHKPCGHIFGLGIFGPLPLCGQFYLIWTYPLPLPYPHGLWMPPYYFYSGVYMHFIIMKSQVLLAPKIDLFPKFP